ncbi:TetR family transcriptional regulator [Halopseudomonas phragmitis]|uniref:TetR family transcriptional regulator n=1 Tax=Halopseudomonas phragmitis TaxID=1931241 RepID=A0A1V0B9C4_9GAMM|nr:TetR/AcrR family transcriptional regulator [Halopseudomonas phragmitis]AQZ96491.1 TetR family transcriptional regulator [Halopseudomonas phragmitis]
MAARTPALRRNPTQSRAEMTLQSIREASLKILEKEGYKRLTTNHIAEVAGISIGTLYQYYADKQAIAADLCNQLLWSELSELNRFDQTTLAHFETSLECTMAFFVREHIARHKRLYQKLKTFYLEIHWQYDFEDYMRRKHPRKLKTVEWLPSALAHHSRNLGVNNYSLAATLVMHMIEGTIHATLDRDPELIMHPEFETELVHAVLGYLHFKPAASPHGDHEQGE